MLTTRPPKPFIYIYIIKLIIVATQDAVIFTRNSLQYTTGVSTEMVDLVLNYRAMFSDR